ncbi:MAG TPA: hypothetical protein VGJ05_05100 [Fimbriiglobus sp.]|jgi:hypothetical protein
MRFLATLPDSTPADKIVSEIAARLSDSAGWNEEELNAEEWSLFVAHGLSDYLNDPREDVYTLEDGMPFDAPR